VVAFGLLSCTGCADGPFYHLKKLNPVIVDQWKKDQLRGPVYPDRIEEFDVLREQISSYSPEEQARYVKTISDVAKSDSSPEIRRRVVMVLENVIQDPVAADAVIGLAQDKNEKVRIAVAKALAKSTNEASTRSLLTMAASDKSQHVRHHATKSLGQHRSDDVKLFLVQQLNEKSPATQASATEALKDFTGADFQGDVAKWKQYMNGEDVASTQPSLADQFFSIWR
jgi:HEAT repeat protein